jgi:ribonuclease-3
MPVKEMTLLMEKLGYVFKDPALLQRALTHRSVNAAEQTAHNERLEFLGDAVLALCVGQVLFEQFPWAKEGQLSRMRAELVKGDSLVEWAKKLSLGDYLWLGQGELKTGGSRRSSILEDAMEALIGALYLDGGLPVAEDFIRQSFQSTLESFTPTIQTLDAKSELQEFLQREGHSIPEYILVRTEGLAHDQEFFVNCEVKALGLVAEGAGRNRKAAEQVAAKMVLDQLKLERKSACR